MKIIIVFQPRIECPVLKYTYVLLMAIITKKSDVLESGS